MEAIVGLSKNFTAGIVAGIAECLATYPLDTIKTRIQVKDGGSTPSSVAIMMEAIKKDGFWSLYRGMASRAMATGVGAAVLFGTNLEFRRSLGVNAERPLATPGLFFAAASLTGIFEASVYTPFDLVKNRMQVIEGRKASTTTWNSAVHIARKYGLVNGLYRGYGVTLMKESFGNIFYFGFYEVFKASMFKMLNTKKNENVIVDSGVFAASGAVAGGFYCLATHPMDTVRSRIQTDKISSPRHRFMHQYAVEVIRNEGMGGLFKGLSPSLVRHVFANAIIFLSFESMVKVLNSGFSSA